MSENSKPESAFLGLYVIPEVTAKRLSKVIRIFLEHNKENQAETILQELIEPMTLSRILKDSNFWISCLLENRILNKLEETLPLSEILFNMGKDFFLSDSFEILPSDDVQIEFEELISRLPLLIDHYIRYIEIKTISYSKNRLKIEFQFQKKIKETWYDLIFLRGILQGASILFQVKGCKTTLLETSLSEIDFRFFEKSRAVRTSSR